MNIEKRLEGIDKKLDKVLELTYRQDEQIKSITKDIDEIKKIDIPNGVKAGVSKLKIWIYGGTIGALTSIIGMFLKK